MLQACLASLLLLVAARLWAAPQPLVHGGAVNDFAHVLSAADQAALEQRAIALESQGVDAVLVTVDSTNGAPISDFTYQLGHDWGVGQKGKNNGVVILLAVRDHKFWTSVGYGLEPYFTDADAGSWGRAQVATLRGGDYAGFFNALLDQITTTVTQRMGTAGQGPPPTAPSHDQQQGAGGGAGGLLIGVLLFFALVMLLSRGGRGCGPAGCLLPWMMTGGGLGGGWSGGGFGGGGGGFGGFGGGDFGGGGGGGSW